MMAIFMPAEFKSLNLNNLLKLQQQQQLQQTNPSSHIFAHESLFKPYHILQQQQQSSSTQSNVNAIMTELNNSSDSVIKNNNNCNNNSEEDTNSNDSDLSVGQEKVQNEVKESPHSDDDDDEMSNASSSQYTTNSSTRLCSPTTMRPATTSTLQFHEEILRSSQLYAEELLRQRIAAAARLQGGNVSSVTDLSEPEPSIISKLSFQTSLFGGRGGAVSSTDTENGNNLFCAKSAINFQNIHSHLSSIAQITQNLSSGSGHNNHHLHHQQQQQQSHVKKDDASLSSLSRESSQSPSGFQQHFKMQQHNHHHQHHHHHHQKLNFHTPSTHQNQLHEHNLKFSIDNILKADFGRRITEPLLKSSKAKRSLRDGKHEKDKVNFFLKRSNNNSNNKNNNANGSSNSVEGQQNDKSLDQTFSTSSTATATTTTSDSASNKSGTKTDANGTVWPAWVFCTRYSDRPSSGRSPRVKKPKKPPSESGAISSGGGKTDDEKRPRTAFSGAQLARLKHEFNENRYLTEKRRQALSAELGLNEAQIKIWFQNKRAKIKKSSGVKNPLALQLMAQGLYNHSTIPLSKEEEELQELQASSGGASN